MVEERHWKCGGRGKPIGTLRSNAHYLYIFFAVFARLRRENSKFANITTQRRNIIYLPELGHGP